MADALAMPPLILVADDDPDILDVLSEILADEGHRVQTAAHGAEALDLALAEVPDLVLIDLMMPVLDGAGFCRAYRDAGGRAPIVLITAAEPSRLPELVESSGANGCIVKPFTIDEILATIARHVVT